jgi:nucleoid-associated protein YgaU
MGRSLGLGLFLLSTLMSCKEPAPRHHHRDTLLLEVGGENPSLREGLRRTDAPAQAMARDAPVARREASPAAAPPPADSMPGKAETAAPPGAASEARPATVVLERGQTLYGLARTHLGAGSRWPEIASLNGWTEADVAGLRAGTVVKLPSR